MASYAGNIRIDENAVGGVGTAKLKVTRQITKRAALGDVGNRVKTTSTGSEAEAPIKGSYKESAKTKTAALKNVKPRVDTRWKKGTTTTVRTRSTSSAAAIVSSLKPLSNGSSIAAGVAAVASATAAEASNPLKKAVVKLKDIGAIRREDSQLNRRSLTKIRQAMRKTPPPLASSESSSVGSDDDQPMSVEMETHSAQLLAQVENIDEQDTSNPLLVTEYVNDIYSYLYHLEREFPIEPDFIARHKEIAPKMRSILIDWINEVHLQFKLETETYQMAVSIIDRYLQAVPKVARKNLQLVGVTALFVASKYEELYPPEINDFVYITDDTYQKREILNMEMQIVRTLGFHLGKPLPIHFLRRFSKAARSENVHHLMSKYFIELASVEYGMAHYKPSEVAAASLFLALHLIPTKQAPGSAIWTPTLQYYSHYSAEHLMPIAEAISRIVIGAPKAKWRAVYQKYSLSKFDQVAKHSALTLLDPAMFVLKDS